MTDVEIRITLHLCVRDSVVVFDQIITAAVEYCIYTELVSVSSSLSQGEESQIIVKQRKTTRFAAGRMLEARTRSLNNSNSGARAPVEIKYQM